MKVAIIGAGNMGGAIARGLLSQTNHKLTVSISNPSLPKLESIKSEYPSVNCSQSNQKSVDNADIVILAVKPWLIESVLRGITLDPKSIVVSIAAGVDFNQFASWTSDSTSLYRLMPNTAIAIKQSMTIISSYQKIAEEDQLIISLFNELGDTILLTEDKMAVATSIASCGIAFLFKYIQASMQAGVELGLTPQEGVKLAAQAAIGAGALLKEQKSHPSLEIDKVTTPGGKTIKGINSLEQQGFVNAIIEAIKASL